MTRNIGPTDPVFQAVARNGQLGGDQEMYPLLPRRFYGRTEASCIPGEIAYLNGNGGCSDSHQLHGFYSPKVQLRPQC